MTVQQTTQNPPVRGHWLSRIHLSLLVSIVTGLAGIYLMIWTPAGLSLEQGRAAGLTLATVGLLATGQLPEHLTALLFFLFAMLLDVAPSSVIFSGFSSAALWMIFAGLVIALAVKSTGLGERLARSVALRLGGHYVVLISGVLLVGLLLGFLMPSSMGRVVLLMPITLSLADYFGFGPGSNGRTAVVLAAAFGTFVPAFAILPANVPNMVLVGASETLFDIAPRYGEYLLLHFPVLGLLKSVVIVALIVWLYPDRPRSVSRDTVVAAHLSRQEWQLTWVLALSLMFWLTDFIHHISPAWVALAAALLLLLPRIGLISAKQFNGEINYNPLFFVAGILGLGALIAHSGLGASLADYLTAVLPLKPGHNLLNFASLSIVSMVTGIVATLPGVPAVLTPLAEQMAHSAGLPVKTVLMTQVLGFSTTLFLYQAPPLVIAMQLAGEKTRPAIKLSLLLAVVTILVLLPVDYLWWRWLGWL